MFFWVGEVFWCLFYVKKVLLVRLGCFVRFFGEILVFIGFIPCKKKVSLRVGVVCVFFGVCYFLGVLCFLRGFGVFGVLSAVEFLCCFFNLCLLLWVLVLVFYVRFCFVFGLPGVSLGVGCPFILGALFCGSVLFLFAKEKRDQDKSKKRQ